VTFTTAQFARFSQCGELYRLQDIERVPVLPTTRQVISRVVRDSIQAEVEQKAARGVLLSPQDARQRVEALATFHMAAPVSLTPAGASQGQRRAYEGVFVEALRLVMAWRVVVGGRINPSAAARPFSLHIAAHDITGHIEIQEDTRAVHCTKVRTRQPSADEADHDLGLTLAALAVEHLDGRQPSELVMDVLVAGEKVGYHRLVADAGRGRFVALEERIKMAAAALEARVFMPADAQDWRCRACQLRPICRYV
jgi:hypothetical protein